MPVQVSYPGVYIQEVSSGVHTITGVSTSIGAFFGRTAKGPIDKAVRLLSFADFLRDLFIAGELLRIRGVVALLHRQFLELRVGPR